jgi:hypothetical protein
MAVKTAVKATGLIKNGFPLTSVSSHSLQAGGAMAMHLKRLTMTPFAKWVGGHLTHS